jgi:hypothetical protein
MMADTTIQLKIISWEEIAGPDQVAAQPGVSGP